MASKRGLYSNRQKRKIIRRIEKGAKEVSRRNLDYGWGGARDFVRNRMIDPPAAGKWTDCSGYAQWLCQKAGLPLKNFVGSTWSLAEEGVAGESPWFTMFIKNNGGMDQHIILRLRRKWSVTRKVFGEFRWVECGGSDNPDLSGGPAFFHPTPSRVAQFYIHRRFPQL
jgi:hypothetical protein